MVSFVGGSASKVDDVTALPSRQKIADMCYYGNIMTTTRWWLCFTILHLQQYSHRLNFGGVNPPLVHHCPIPIVRWCKTCKRLGTKFTRKVQLFGISGLNIQRALHEFGRATSDPDVVQGYLNDS